MTSEIKSSSFYPLPPRLTRAQSSLRTPKAAARRMVELLTAQINNDHTSKACRRSGATVY